MSREINFAGTRVADDTDCYVIAEIGHNHQGDVEKCKQLFRAAKEAGADAVKLQKRDNRTLFTGAMFNQIYNSENAFAPTYGAHREALEFNRDQYVELKKFAADLAITFFATAFDIPSADFLEALDMPFYKIASADLTNIPLIRHVAAFGKPLIVSTGGGMLDDVRRVCDAVLPVNRQLAILQCTASYPCDVEKLNLRVIETFRAEFPDVVVGLSSHDNGIAMPLIAYILGGRIVEKHFTLNRAMKGTDHAFSLEPVGLRKMVRDLRRSRAALGDGVKAVLPEEEAPIKKMAKKLVAARGLLAGHLLTAADVAFKSPGDGLPPYQIDKVLGRRIKTAMAEDDAIAFELLED